MKKEIESCGEGLQTSPYNTRRLKHLTVSAVQEKFEHSFKLQLNKIPTPFMEREQTLRLCRGQDLRVCTHCKECAYIVIIFIVEIEYLKMALLSGW